MLPALPLACQTSALLMSYAPNGVPSRTLTSNLEFRKLPLCALSYGDELLRASGNAPELGTHQVRPAYKAEVLFELRAHEWRNAVGLHHILQKKDAFVSTEARSA